MFRVIVDGFRFVLWCCGVFLGFFGGCVLFLLLSWGLTLQWCPCFSSSGHCTHNSFWNYSCFQVNLEYTSIPMRSLALTCWRFIQNKVTLNEKQAEYTWSFGIRVGFLREYGFVGEWRIKIPIVNQFIFIWRLSSILCSI